MKPRSKESDSRSYGSYETWSQRPSFTGTPKLQAAEKTYVTGGVYTQYHGFDIENYHRRVRRGDLLPFTEFSQETYRVLEAETGIYDTVYAPQNERWYFTPDRASWGPAYKKVTLDSLRQLAGEVAADLDPSPFVQAAAAKVYASGHDTLTFLSELHKVNSMFHGLAKRAKSLIQRVNAAEAAKRGGRAWLESRYGWRPLVLDMLEMQKQLTKLDDERKRFSDRVGSSHQILQTEQVVYSDRTVSIEHFIEDIIDVSLRGSVCADINPPKFQFNPVLTGWELIRFSFIVDWFLGVGTWLEALSFQLISTNYAAAGGYKINIRRSIQPGTPVFTPQGSGNVEGISYLVEFEVVSRIPQTVPLRPFANVNLNVFKVVDLVAIFGGALKNFTGSLRI